LNAASLSKPGAIEHLAVDLKSYGADVAVVTETHFRSKHADSAISIDGFYRAMHFSAKRGIAIACRLSDCPSLCL